MPTNDHELAALLSEKHMVTEADLERAFSFSSQKSVNLVEALIQLDLLSDDKIGEVVASQHGLPFVKLSTVHIPEEILELVPEIVAKKQSTIVFEKDKDGLKVATATPDNNEFLNFLAKKTGENVAVYYATPRDVEESLNLYRKELQKTFDELFSEQLDELGKTVQTEAPIAKILDLLIEYAYQNKASDIHIEPSDHDSLVRFRVDGILHDVLTIPRALHEQIVTRVKVLSRLRTDEHLSAQDGKMQLKLEKEDLDIRVSIVPIIEGEKAVLRLLSSRSRQFSLADLGMSEEDFQKVTKGFSRPFGMVLATGPTGSGKTTTIYSIIKILNTRDKNIATIEDPVEYDIEGVNQIQVNPKTNLTFADGLKAILRQDPDIIFVGEVRDKETAGVSINSAMTGHLVLSTLHTNDAATALPRLIDMGVEPFLVASTTNIVIGQRLVRKICENCKVSYEAKHEDLKKAVSETEIEKIFEKGAKVKLYKGEGCPLCHNSGYQGRIGIFEVLVVDKKLKELINKKCDAQTLEREAIAGGMTTMIIDGLMKVKQGLTTLEEILRATKG